MVTRNTEVVVGRDTDGVSLTKLQEAVATLARRVETGIAKLASDQQRRNSSVELSRQVQQLTDSLAKSDAAMEEQEERSRQLRNKSVVFTLALSYADLISDLVLATVLLLGTQTSYGVASLMSILSVSLVAQLLMVKFYGKQPWFSKDIHLTAFCLGPALEAYRLFAGEPAGPPGAFSATVLLGALKAIEVALEMLPAVVLQLMLLNASHDNWASPELLVSLSISITAAAVLMVDAESTMNRAAGARRRYIEYFGYLPLNGGRRAVL
jgi:hypothetical protein